MSETLKTLLGVNSASVLVDPAPTFDFEIIVWRAYKIIKLVFLQTKNKTIAVSTVHN